MAALTITDVTASGINAPSLVSASCGGDTAKNDNSDIFLWVKNSDASAHTVTVTAQKPSPTVPGFGQVTKSDVSVQVPATSGEKLIGPFPTIAYNQTDGTIAITYDDVTGVTIAAVRLPRQTI